MLQRIRDSLQGQRWVAYIVLGVLAVVFAAWGAYGIVELNFGGAPYAAKVEGEKIPIERARNAWMQQQAVWIDRLGGNDLPEELKTRLQDQLLEDFVRSTLLKQRADELGYAVTDKQLREAIAREPAFQIDGKYSPEVAKAALARVGLSPAAFEADLRENLQQRQVQSAISISNFLTPYEMQRMTALQEEERQVQFITLPAEKFAGKLSLSDAEIEKAYQENLSRYMNPEYVRLAYAELRTDQLAAQVTVTDQEISDFYEKSKDRFVTPEKRHVRHILISVEGNKEDEARKEAEQVLADAKAGKDFAQLAKQHSDDTGSAQQGGDLGFIERSYFEGAFADAAFAMASGEIRGPVRTEYGYHIIKVEEIQPGSTRTLEQAREEIRAELQRERAADRLNEVQQALEARIEAPDADLEAVAKEFGMTVGQVERFERGSGGAPLGNSEDLQEAVFSTQVIDERRIAGPVPLGEDRLILVKVLEHQQAAPKPLAEVRDDVIATLRKQRGTEEAVKAAEAARAELEAGASFESVAKKLGVDVEAPRYIGREDPSVPAQVRALAFRSPKPKSGSPVIRTVALDSGGAALVAVTDVRTGNDLPNPQLRDARAQAAMARGGAGDFVAYLEEIRRTADVEKNPKAFE